MSRPRTRPHPLDPGILEAIQERLIAGESMRQICEDPTMPTQGAVYLAMAKDPKFRGEISHAREAAQEALIDSTIDIADAVDPEKRGAVEKARLQIWARQWRAAKLAPKKYGEKIQIEDDGPKKVLSRDETLAQLAASGLTVADIFGALTKPAEPVPALHGAPSSLSPAADILDIE